jgi:hypothetical protein
MFHNQVSATRRSRSREDNALYRPGYGLQERGTHEGFVRGRSLYVQASKRPMLTTTLVALCGGLALAALARPRKAHGGGPASAPARRETGRPDGAREPARHRAARHEARARHPQESASPQGGSPHDGPVATASPTGMSHI